MKKLFAILLAMLLVVASVPMVSAADAATVTIPTTTWEDDGNYDDTWFAGHDADTTYEIDTAAKLAGLLKLSRSNSFKGKTIYITADIDLAGHKWTSIGSVNLAFEGLVEGKKGGVEGAAVTISNMISTKNDRAGFVSRHANGGVKNLTFDNAYVEGAGYTGVVSGDVRLASKETYVAENITIQNSTVKSPGGNCVGVMFGCANLWGLNLTWSNLTVKDSYVEGNSEAGAVIGRATWGTIALEACAVVDCTVKALNGCAAAILAWTDMTGVTINNCYVSGSIIADSLENGIATGFLSYTQNPIAATISNCQNDAIIVTASGKASAFFGGANPANENSTLSISNCISLGITKGVNGFEWIIADSKNVKVTAENCYSIMPSQLTSTVTTQTMTPGATLTGLDYTTVWKARADKFPVLAIAENYSADTYATADLSWFTPDVTDAKYTLTTEAQVVGLGLLSHVCSPMDYDIVTAEAVREKLNAEGLFNPSFLAGYDPAGTSAPKADGIDGVRSENENWKSTADLFLNKMSLFINNPSVWTATDGTDLRIFVEVPTDATFSVFSVSLIVNVDPTACPDAMDDPNGFGKVVSGTFTGDGKASAMTWNGGAYAFTDGLGLSSSDYIVKAEDGKWVLEVKYTLPENAKTALTTGSYEIEVDAAVTYTNGQVNFNSKTNVGAFDVSGKSATAVKINIDPNATTGNDDTTDTGNKDDDTGKLPTDDETTADSSATTDVQNTTNEKSGCKSTLNSAMIVFSMMVIAALLVVTNNKKHKVRNH